MLSEKEVIARWTEETGNNPEIMSLPENGKNGYTWWDEYHK